MDGLIGQGFNLLVLVTTNEPVGKLHPAVVRQGRCLAEIEFGPLGEPRGPRLACRAGRGPGGDRRPHLGGPLRGP